MPVYRRLLIRSASASRKLAESSSSGLNCFTILKAKAAHSLAVPRSRSTRRIDRQVLDFVKFVCSQRLPVSMSLIQKRARLSAESNGIIGLSAESNGIIGLSAESNGIIGFKASRGWMQKFLRRTGTQKSLRLHGKGSSAMPSDHAQRMEELRSLDSSSMFIIFTIKTNPA